MKIYGCKISYYTGKLETYLRYRSVPYQVLPTVGHEKELLAGAGVVQMPVVHDDKGRWMTDTTPIIAKLESEQRAPSVYPEDSLLNFLALLIEDYADEWLWRPAMHYRWSYQVSRSYAAEVLYHELIKENPKKHMPRFLALNFLKARQYFGFVQGDGVTKANRHHVESTYFQSLALLEAIFEQRPFVMGNTPTIADIGLMGPMLRHFGQDPVPAEIMRETAPRVYEWVARMWNLQSNGEAPDLIQKPDGLLVHLIKEIAETHLAQLQQNAAAWSRGLKRFDMTVQGVSYPKVPTSRYRVWCLEELQRHWDSLNDDAQQNLKTLLGDTEAQVLWQSNDFKPSQYDVERTAPFNKGINVFGKGVPPR